MEDSRKARRKQVKKRKWPKVLLIIVAVLLVIVVAIGAVINSYLNKISYDDPYEKTQVEGDILTDDTVSTITEGEGELPEPLPQFDLIENTDEAEEAEEMEETQNLFDLSKLGEFQDGMRQWCSNGSPVSSRKVTNILLIGMDNFSEDLTVNGRADAMILISINTESGQITMTSLLRDAYAYVTNGEAEAFEKMHQSILRAGPALLIQTIERHYKVHIDNYIAVNRTSFPEVIDTIGGIEIDVTQAEADFLGLYPGRQTLDGDTAMRYARIRKLDSDYARTGRHQTVLLAILEKAKSCSLSEMVELVDALLPCVRTGMTKADIIAMGTKALTSGWLKYDVTTQTFPFDNHRQPQMLDDLFYWMVDYPHAAQDLQLSIYGATNIELEE